MRGERTMTLPDYLDCKDNEDPCDYLLHKECPNTCVYALSLGIGAMMVVPGSLEKEVEE